TSRQLVFAHLWLAGARSGRDRAARRLRCSSADAAEKLSGHLPDPSGAASGLPGDDPRAIGLSVGLRGAPSEPDRPGAPGGLGPFSAAAGTRPRCQPLGATVP